MRRSRLAPKDRLERTVWIAQDVRTDPGWIRSGREWRVDDVHMAQSRGCLVVDVRSARRARKVEPDARRTMGALTTRPLPGSAARCRGGDSHPAVRSGACWPVTRVSQRRSKAA